MVIYIKEKIMPKPYLGNPVRVEAVLRTFQFSFRKKFGQNFLIDEDVLEGIVDASGVTEDDVVLEIGPGIGSLTQYLASRARKVIAVEIDKTLLPILDHTLEGWDNVKVLNQDILKTDIASIANEENEGRPLKVIANLPYYITTPIIMKLFENGSPIDSVTVMIQKEVAERIGSAPGSKQYGAISLAVQYYASVTTALEVGPESFVPQPKVSSTVIRLDRFPTPPVKVDDEEQMFKIIRGVFNQRRKTLINGVANFEGLSFSKDDIRKALTAMGLPETTRGETLSLEQFAELSNHLSEQ
jgi:16S rRNA (adenine1518-N6/adenine1519-N6)-dimethyltransferase